MEAALEAVTQLTARQRCAVAGLDTQELLASLDEAEAETARLQALALRLARAGAADELVEAQERQKAAVGVRAQALSRENAALAALLARVITAAVARSGFLRSLGAEARYGADGQAGAISAGPAFMGWA